MSEFADLRLYVVFSIPVFLLLTAIFYMGYRKSCRLTPLVLSQFFGFFAVMAGLFLLDIYGIVTGRFMSVIYLVTVAVFYLGGATLTGSLMRSKQAAETGQPEERRGER